MKNFTYILITIAILLPFGAAQAETVYRVGADANVAKDQVVKNDLYISSGLFARTTIAGDVMGDVYTYGSAVSVTGSVGADIFAVGGDVVISASTSDDVRVVAGDVMVDGSVGGDLFVMGGTVKVTESANIEGDILVFAGDVSVDGTVAGSVFGSAERVSINGSVGGDVEVKASTRLVLGEEASISGSVIYESRNEMARAQSSVVEGEVQKRSIAAMDDSKPVQSTLTPLFVLLFSALALYLLFKPQLQDMTQDVYAHPLITGGIGVGAVFAGPLVAMVLILTVLAAPLGIAIAGFLALLFGVGFVLAGVVFGVYSARWLFGIDTLELPVLIGGVIVLYAIMYIPVLGVLFFSLIYFVTIGSMVRFIARKLSR